MMTVRFPTGFSVQYNDANYIVWGVNGGRATLFDKKDGERIAFVPDDCIIEWRAPCRMYGANLAPMDLLDELNRVLADPRRRSRLSTYEVAALKRLLVRFDAKRRTWR